MKCIKNILYVLITMTMVLSVAAITSFAATETSIRGEELVYLPGSGAVMVDYNLVDPNGDDVEDYVLYSISSDDANQKDWIDVNRNSGEVYIKGDANGKTFTVKAESALYTATKSVRISSTVLWADFEDDQIPSWIYNDSADYTIKKNGTNKYLNVACRGDWATTYPTLRFKEQGIELKSDYFNYEMKFIISHKKEGTGPHPESPITIRWENADGMGNGKSTINNTSFALPILSSDYNESTKTRQLHFPGVWNSGGNVSTNSEKNNIGDPVLIDELWYDETTHTFNEGFKFETLRVEVADSIIYATVGKTRTTYTRIKDINMNLNDADVASIELSGAIDDILIYTGKKVDYTFGIAHSKRPTIEGDCMLSLPESGTVKLTYNLVDPDGNDVSEDVVYSVLSDDEESNKWIEIDSKTGVVDISGDAAGKSFMVSATSRTYSASQIVEISETALSVDVVDGAPTKFRAMNREGQDYPNILDNAKIATLEGKVMFESENMERIGQGTGHVLYQHNSTVNFDIRYGFITKDLAYITLNMEGGYGDASSKDIIYVPSDEWIDLRVEFDNSDATFNFFVNDIKVVESEKHSVPSLYFFFETDCTFDDLSFYNGVKDVEVGSTEPFFKIYKDDEELSDGTMNFTWNEKISEDDTAAVAAVILTDEDLTDKGFIITIYNSTGRLVAVGVAEATKNAAGMSLARSKVYGSISKGSYAKIFLWNIKSLEPVK